VYKDIHFNRLTLFLYCKFSTLANTYRSVAVFIVTWTKVFTASWRESKVKLAVLIKIFLLSSVQRVFFP